MRGLLEWWWPLPDNYMIAHRQPLIFFTCRIRRHVALGELRHRQRLGVSWILGLPWNPVNITGPAETTQPASTPAHTPAHMPTQTHQQSPHFFALLLRTCVLPLLSPRASLTPAHGSVSTIPSRKWTHSACNLGQLPKTSSCKCLALKVYCAALSCSFREGCAMVQNHVCRPAGTGRRGRAGGRAARPGRVAALPCSL